MTPEEYRRRVLETEAWGAREIDLLSTVPARALPRAGESNAIQDAVAGMARRQANARHIQEVEQAVHHLGEVIDADFYGDPRPVPPTDLAADQERRWTWIWAERTA